jgi:YVTN family beta-propeller protein
MEKSYAQLSSTISRLLLCLLAASSIVCGQSVGPRETARSVKAGGGEAAAAPPATVSQRYEKEGIVIDFTAQATPDERGRPGRLVEGANAVTSFRIKDARTGQPVTGLHPSGWLLARKSEQPTSEAMCKDKVRTLVGGLLSIRADVDLNNYLLVTLNHDKTITYINPQISFSTTRLEGITQLPGAGADWALSQNKEFLYVTMPDQSAVAVINTLTKKLLTSIQTGDKTRPMRIAVQPDGRYVWVGLDNSSQAVAIDTSNNRLAATVQVGTGLHNLAFTSDSRVACVSNSASDNVSLIDTKSLNKLADISVGKTPVPVAYSSASRMFYVANINGASIAVIDPARRQLVKTIPVKRGVVALRFEPNGRFGFVVNQVESTVSVLDAATNSITASAAVVKSPDQVSFTSRYAYVRGLDSEKISLIEISGAASGRMAPVDVTVGRTPASTLPEEIGVSDMIAPAPEGNAVMVANTPDQMVYYYVEGMMAPMGTFTNYKRRPHALMLIDRSLSEVEPGLYSTTVKLTGAGRYDVPFLLDQPRVVNCFQMEVGESPDGKKLRAGSSVAVEAMFRDKSFKPAETVPLRFKLTDPASKQPLTGLKDVQVLVFEPPGLTQQRQWAREVGEGVYEVTQSFPHEGLYNVMLRIASRGLGFADLPFTQVKVLNPAKP